MSQQQARAVLIAVLLAGSAWTLQAWMLWGPGYGTSDTLRRLFVTVPPMREVLFIAVLWLCCMACQAKWFDVLLTLAVGICAGHLVWP